MWNYLYALWRSVLRRRPKEEPPAPRELREELRRLLEERATLHQAAASYREFGYDELAGRTREEIAAVDRKIGGIRLRLHRGRLPPGA